MGTELMNEDSWGVLHDISDLNLYSEERLSGLLSLIVYSPQ